ncbi:MAG: hypothetical protein COB07_02255 [Sulfurovum sp.]|nr:MAG: hypothetical protein COB07_02255 [Sulfurovum sp.]
MKHLRKLSTIAATGLGALLATGVTGCTQQQQQEQQQAKGAFVIIEETAPGKYKIVDEFPADETRIVLKKLDGSENVLTQAQLDALIKEEAAKVDAGTSELTQENPQASQGMGLGSTIMASMAGAMLGAWIGNKLFGNQNYQNNRKAGYKSPSTYSKSKKSFSKSRTSTSKRGGFFGGKKSSSRSGGFFGG